MVHEVLFKRNAAHHNGGQFIALLLGSDVKFSFKAFFTTQPIPAASLVNAAVSRTVLTSMLSHMVNQMGIFRRAKV